MGKSRSFDIFRMYKNIEIGCGIMPLSYGILHLPLKADKWALKLKNKAAL